MSPSEPKWDVMPFELGVKWAKNDMVKRVRYSD